jgi:hypothetical protein
MNQKEISIFEIELFSFTEKFDLAVKSYQAVFKNSMVGLSKRKYLALLNCMGLSSKCSLSKFQIT